MTFRATDYTVGVSFAAVSSLQFVNSTHVLCRTAVSSLSLFFIASGDSGCRDVVSSRVNGRAGWIVQLQRLNHTPAEAVPAVDARSAPVSRSVSRSA